MADLGTGRKPMIMPHYPHMLAEDVAVWSEFLTRFPDAFDEVWYDVHVGSAVPVPAGAPEFLSKVSAGVTRKRIDVVGRKGLDYLVIEVKPYGNMVALGQCVSYTSLFLKEFPAIEVAYPAVVCQNMDPDLTDEFESQGAIVYEVGLEQ